MILHGPLSNLDLVALGLLVLAWLGAGWVIEHPPASRPSVMVLMRRYRREWMRQFVTRQPRMFDSALIASLRQGATFFASTSLLAVGGALAVIGNPERLMSLTAELPIDRAPVLLWLGKVLVAALFAANAFLKFVWSHRLFGYASITMGAVPNEVTPQAYARADQAADLLITGARSYESGMRSVYFGLAALVWLAGAWPLVAATVVATLVLLRREFASASRRALMHEDRPF
ncbi:DUF599 domain-containing protein [Paracoccus sp. p4-l81]|uniref:DUF599 domain-containing protein n=1 Tax=unclassified Paracoccus (in: a-proteobacteria) TaxID=2688777 RepID=UPI0035B6D184